MNERIRELLEQAVVSVDIVTGNESLDDELAKMYIPDCFAEKFAELLIRECVGVADDYVKECLCEDHIKCNHPRSKIGIKIKEHFGVEE